MKSFLLVFCAIWIVGISAAQNSMDVIPEEGPSSTHLLSDVRTIKFVDGNALIQLTDDYTVHELGEIQKIVFSQNILTRSSNELPEDGVSLYPNPATDIITLELDEALPTGSVVRILDLSGRVVQRVATGSQQNLSFSVSTLPKGVYTLELPHTHILFCKQ